MGTSIADVRTANWLACQCARTSALNIFEIEQSVVPQAHQYSPNSILQHMSGRRRLA